MLVLYGSPYSTCTTRVVMSFTILGLRLNKDWKFVSVNMKTRDHKSETFLAKQPFGQIPVLEHDGFTLFESRTIILYVCALFPEKGNELAPRLAPSAPFRDDSNNILPSASKFALFQQAASIESANFDPFASTAVKAMIFYPMQGKPKDQKLFEENIALLDERLDGYERILSKSTWLAGAKMTVADTYHLPYATLVSTISDVLTNSKRPNVTRWIKALMELPAWKVVKDGVPEDPAAYEEALGKY